MDIQQHCQDEETKGDAIFKDIGNVTTENEEHGAFKIPGVKISRIVLPTESSHEESVVVPENLLIERYLEAVRCDRHKEALF